MLSQGARRIREKVTLSRITRFCCRAGDFMSAGFMRLCPVQCHLAGIPSYLLVAELALNHVLHGQLPRPQYPRALRAAAPPIWRDKREQTLRYTRSVYIPRGQVTEIAGALATAGMQTAHGVLAARGEWVTNEKQLLHRAGLRELDQIVAGLRPDPKALDRALFRAQDLLRSTE